MQLGRPIRTRFPYGSAFYGLTLLHTITHRFILQEARRHPVPKNMGLRQLVGTRFQVLFHSPHWGTFHLSLTVLVHYRSLRVLSLTRWSSRIRTGFHVSGTTWERNVEACVSRLPFRLRGYYPLRLDFPDVFD